MSTKYSSALDDGIWRWLPWIVPPIIIFMLLLDCFVPTFMVHIPIAGMHKKMCIVNIVFQRVSPWIGTASSSCVSCRMHKFLRCAELKSLRVFPLKNPVDVFLFLFPFAKIRHKICAYHKLNYVQRNNAWVTYQPCIISPMEGCYVLHLANDRTSCLMVAWVVYLMLWPHCFTIPSLYLIIMNAIPFCRRASCIVRYLYKTLYLVDINLIRLAVTRTLHGLYWNNELVLQYQVALLLL